MLRERVCAPEPHDCVHGVHAIHSDTTQSTGQASLAHDCVSCRYGHTLPPLSACARTERERLCEPPPQVDEHAVHWVYAVTVQWTGHGLEPQGCTSLSGPQVMPPLADAVMMVRDRVWEPAAV